MRETPGRWQWSVSVVVYHGPGYGHVTEIIQQSKGREPLVMRGGAWNTLGIPEAVLNQLRTAVDAIITEHLTTRYGVQGELPVKWAGEPDPF